MIVFTGKNSIVTFCFTNLANFFSEKEFLFFVIINNKSLIANRMKFIIFRKYTIAPYVFCTHYQVERVTTKITEKVFGIFILDTFLKFTIQTEFFVDKSRSDLSMKILITFFMTIAITIFTNKS